MFSRFVSGARMGVVFCLFVLAVIAILTIIPARFGSKAQIKTGSGLFTRTTTQNPDLPDFDIRTDKASAQILDQFRQAAGFTAVQSADLRDAFVQGESDLRSRVPTLKVEYSDLTRKPELITPDPLKQRAVLDAPTQDRVGTLRSFIKENDSLVGVTDQQVDSLKVQTDFVNKKGGIGLVILEQEFNGVPVFRGEISGHFSNKGELFRVVNNLAAGVDERSLSTDFGNPADGVRIAADNVGFEVDMTPNAERSSGNKFYFGGGYYPSSAWKQYFTLEPGIVRPVWYVQVWGRITAYEMIIDAETGKILWRVNMGKDQTQSVQYNVWSNLTSGVLAMDSPAPLTPGPIDPALGTQGTLQSRTLFSLIGNEAPNPGMNQNGWITDGGNTTSGNNTTAGLDRDTTDGPEVVTGSPSRVFNFAINPAPGNPAPGDAPVPTTPTPCVAAPPAQTDYQKASATQMFYVVNRLHDALYAHGFTELTRNFQTDNFGRGGSGGDAVFSEGQDCSGTNNANMSSSTTDGTTSRMQMYIFTAPTPDRDGTMDADIIIHEIGHGVTNRNHINGISGTQGGQIHEGNGDFQAHLLLSESSDPINGTYSTGGYATLGFRTGPPFSTVGNYYYGIRRFPKAVKAFTGGPLNRPHNPLTYADIDPAQMNLTDGAFAPAFTGSATAVHDGGEIWSSMLWEVRSRLVQRLGHAAGTSKMLQLWMDSMRLTTSTSSMLNSRNAMLQAAQFTGASPELTGADVADVWAGFATRGLGFSASNPSGNTVVEAFNLPELSTSGSPSVTSGNNLLEPNECNTLNIPISNNSANSATGITAVLSSTTPGITVSQPNSAYPDMPSGTGPVNNTTPFQVSTSNSIACFTQASFTLTITFTGGGGGSPVVTNFALPVGNPGANYASTTQTGQTIPAGGVGPIAGSQADDAAVTVPLPAGWNSTVYGTPVTSLSASTNGALRINGVASTAFDNTALPGAAFGIGLFPYWDDLIMTTASVTGGGIYTNTIGTAPNRQFYIEWRAQHFDETTSGPITTNFAILLTEGSDVVKFVYALTGIGAQLNGASATVGIQAAATGTQFTQFSFNGASLSVGLQITYARPPGQCTPGTGTCASSIRSRADFDGDGRTDLSVFRPSEGNWYLQRSTAGFGVLNWGIASDVLAPGDFDGDGKADTAVFRANADSAQPDFYILNSNGFTLSGVSWGVAGDIPISGDYDGDGKTDVAVFRPSTNTFFILNSGGGITVKPYGVAGDIPVAGDFVGDSKADIAIYRPATNQWWVFNGVGDTVTTFGAAGDILVPADYSGDNKDDIAVFRPSTGQWIYLPSSGGAAVFAIWGASGDIPVPGDYDGDGKDDQAIYRNGQWWLLRSTAGVSVANFGLATDKAIPRTYIP